MCAICQIKSELVFADPFVGNVFAFCTLVISLIKVNVYILPLWKHKAKNGLHCKSLEDNESACEMQCDYSKKPRDYLNKPDPISLKENSILQHYLHRGQDLSFITWLEKNYNDLIRQIVKVFTKNRHYKLCRRFYLKLKNVITDKYKSEKNLEKPKKWLL